MCNWVFFSANLIISQIQMQTKYDDGEKKSAYFSLSAATTRKPGWLGLLEERHWSVFLMSLCHRVMAFLCHNCLTCCWRWGSNTAKFCWKDGISPSGTVWCSGSKLMRVSPCIPACLFTHSARARCTDLTLFSHKGAASFGIAAHTCSCWVVGNFLILVLKFYNQPERGSLLKQTSGTFFTLQNG